MALSKKKEAQGLDFQNLVIVIESDLLVLDCGDRSAETFKSLYDQLKKFKVLFYCTDHWKGFNKVIDPKRLYQGKDKTISI